MVLSSRSGLIGGHVFHSSLTCNLTGVHPLLPVACSLQRKACFQGQGSLEVLSLWSRLFGESCVKGQG